MKIKTYICFSCGYTWEALTKTECPKCESKHTMAIYNAADGITNESSGLYN